MSLAWDLYGSGGDIEAARGLPSGYLTSQKVAYMKLFTRFVLCLISGATEISKTLESASNVLMAFLAVFDALKVLFKTICSLFK